MHLSFSWSYLLRVTLGGSECLNANWLTMVDALKGSVSSIFKRGGNKQETNAAPEQLATEQQKLDKKLDELEVVWSLPKQA